MKVKKISENGVAITLLVSQWGGRRTLKAQDLGAGVNLPPETLASLGSKKIFDPSEIKIFNTLKARAERVLKNNGVGNLVARACWVVPTHKAEAVVEELRQIKAEFDAAKATFMASYDRKLEEWLLENEEWRRILEDSLLSREEVAHKMGFNWHAFSFGETSLPGLNAELDEKMSGLTGRLFAEVGQVAKDSYEKSFEGNLSARRRALGPLRTIREKLDGFEMVSPQVAPIVEDIDVVLASIPDNGQPFEGMEFLAVSGMLTMLKNPREALDYAQRKLDGRAGTNPFAAWQAQNGFVVPKEEVVEEESTTEPAEPAENPVFDEPAAANAPATVEGQAELPVFDDEEEESSVAVAAEPVSAPSPEPAPQPIAASASYGDAPEFEEEVESWFSDDALMASAEELDAYIPDASGVDVSFDFEF